MNKAKLKMNKFFIGKKTVTKKVSGTVVPANSSVQIYVLSADGMWYLQPEAKVQGIKWSCKCFFGKTVPFGKSYKLVALLTDQRPTSPIASLPDGVVKSNEVLVIRRGV